ncbi:MAG: hypothetical protein MZV65_13815 [Chromatiales bacterium]|nr:hypothetical protein [Chromatiales bacterium]
MLSLPEQGPRRLKGAITGAEQNRDLVAASSLIAARSGLPSPLKSPAGNGYRIASRRDIDRRAKSTVTIAEQKRDGVAIVISYRQIEFAVLVKVAAEQ